MNKNYSNLNIDQIKTVFSVLRNCMDDFLFLYDLQEDTYMIDDTALQRFRLERAEFVNLEQGLRNVVHPDDFAALIEDIRLLRTGRKTIHNLEYRWMDRQNHSVWISCRGQVVPDAEGKPHFLIGRIMEIDKKEKIDGVTGLYRGESLKRKLNSYALEENVSGYLLQIGIDNFKDINEKYGLATGNEVLQKVSECVCQAARGTASVYRMHGDEMMVLYIGPADEKSDSAKAMYKKIRTLVDEVIARDGFQLFYTISAGIVYFNQTDIRSDSLLEKAAYSLHQAKLEGKNTSVCYTKDSYDAYIYKMDMQEYLRKDIKNNFHGFSLYYQPIVYIKEGRVLGAEALLRWNSEQLGKVSPAEFIPLLEESGLIIPLGRWIVRTALKQCKQWQKLIPGFRISINLSFVQLNKSDAVRDIMNLIDELEADASDVLFEVTESGELEKENAVQVLRSFKSRFINLAIDDFGTGYSNLRYVKDMTFDLVKIDQSFIRNICTSQYDYLLVKQFTELAHTLHLEVCYEGVETREQLDCVLEMNPDYIQGFYFSRPVPAGEFEDKFIQAEAI